MLAPSSPPRFAPGILGGLVLASAGLVTVGLEALLRFTGAVPHGLWHVPIAVEGLDLALTSTLFAVATRELGRRAPLPADRPALSVLIAAFDEAASIVGTVRAVAAQEDVALEILVGDDGSGDGTTDALVAAFGLDEHLVGTAPGPAGAAVPLRVLRLPRGGKGRTLNVLAGHARHPVLVTLDADGVPGRGALAALAGAFADPGVDAAAGMITVRNGRGNWLLRHQAVEYQRTSLIRIGWAALGGLEQLPGAFTGVRAARFTAAGGFPEDSITEDYELAYRLLSATREAEAPPRIVTVPAAQVLTDAPSTVVGFVGQRTRWFAGFLSTLARFPGLLFDARLGVFGLVRLPLKVVDALVPLAVLVAVVGSIGAGASPWPSLSRAALALLGVRLGFSLVFHAVADRRALDLGERAATEAARPAVWLRWGAAATEPLVYFWLRQVAILRAYPFAARRLRTWEESRLRVPPSGGPSAP